MEPIRGWGCEGTAAWLRGLHSSIQQYSFEDWNVSGEDLLRLSAKDLEKLGVKSIGHQELILEAVEQLCALSYELKTDSLRSLTEKLKKVCVSLCTYIRSHRKVSSYDGASLHRPPTDLLTCVIQLVSAARSLFSWLNRYLFTRLNDFSASREVIALCTELAEIVHEDSLSLFEKEDRILTICQNISGVCENILGCSPESLLNQRASLETVHLVPVPPEDSLGIEITSTSFGLHFVSGTLAESPAGHSAKVLPGDEIIQVNGQVVVGWSRMNLVKKLLEKSSGVTLVLKKVTLSSPDQPSSPSSPQIKVISGHSASSAATNFNNDESPTSSIVASPSAIVPEFPKSYDTEKAAALDIQLPSHNENASFQEGATNQTGVSDISADRTGVIADVQDHRSPSFNIVACESASPAKESQIPDSVTKTSSGSQAVVQREGSIVNKRKQKGVATRLSRRRVSCKDLGQADCDGWLWKKKENPGFMSQRWKRCWCHLTGNSLYWYNQPHDEKAIGLINVSSYYLESSRDAKKKYEFQLSHEKYKPFVFAADTLSDMSMWVTRLITSVSKNTAQKVHHHKEEDCYSESEADDQEEESPRLAPGEGKREVLKPLAQAQYPLQSAQHSGSKENLPPKSPLALKRPESYAAATSDPPEEDIDVLFKCLKQGGVSLIGKERLLTSEQFRKSFAKRNKNPLINERVHEVRTLQSTLKSKMAELQVLDQVLKNPALTSDQFKSWKNDHEELYKELQSLWVQRTDKERDSSVESSLTSVEDVGKASPMEATQGTGSLHESARVQESKQEVKSSQEMCSPEEMTSPWEGITPQGLWNSQETWSPLDMGSPLVFEKLMGSLEDLDLGVPKETSSVCETRSLQEKGNLKEVSCHETASLRERRTTSEKRSPRQKGSYRETENTQERRIFQTESSRKKGSTRDKEGSQAKASPQERKGSETGSIAENEKTREKRSHRERKYSDDTESCPEKSVRESASHRESRHSPGGESQKKMGSTEEVGLAPENSSPSKSRSSSGRKSRRETDSSEQELKNSPSSGQDGEKGEKRMYLCI